MCSRMPAERALPVTMNEMLLRGCMLKNSNYVLGMVVYTGRESRIQMNAAATPNKVGARTAPPSCPFPLVPTYNSQLRLYGRGPTQTRSRLLPA